MTRRKACPTPEPQCSRIVPLEPCPRTVDITFSQPSRTRQEFKEECDINQIMKRYFRTGVVSHVNKYQGSYGDCPSMDFQEALETVRKGDEMFSELPAKIRARFENDPAQFLDFVNDETNREEAALLGLLEEPTSPPPEEPPTPPPPTGGDD